jgi:hypothetical protein
MKTRTDIAEENVAVTPAISLAFWLFMATAGYAFVAGALCHRANPFASAEGNAYELPKLLAAALGVWLLGARHTLRPFRAPWRRVLLWNGLGWAVPFFAAFVFHYLDRILKVDFGLTPHSFATMSAYAWLIFGLAASLIAGLAAYHAFLAWRAGILLYWAGALVAVVGTIALLSVFWRETHSVHIHHFFLFGMFVPWLRFHNPVSVVCQAVCAGISVEGVATYGMDPTWYPLH